MPRKHKINTLLMFNVGVKKVLLTGASGFLGREILGSKSFLFTTLGRHPSMDLRCDVVHGIGAASPVDIDVVIHAAGMAHVVPRSKGVADSFFRVNLEGTRNLCDWIERWEVLPKVFVFISTVAVYGLETGENISEDAPLLGETPYAKSKIEAEQFLAEWSKKNGIRLVILRLPLVAGQNPLGNLGAMIKAIQKAYYFRIGDGGARRSMVLASDMAKALPDIFRAEGTFNLTDGFHPSFAELDTYIASSMNKRVKVIPQSVANLMARVGDLIPGSPFNSDRLSKMSSTLTFCDRKARDSFGWSPRTVIGNLDI